MGSKKRILTVLGVVLVTAACAIVVAVGVDALSQRPTTAADTGNGVTVLGSSDTPADPSETTSADVWDPSASASPAGRSGGTPTDTGASADELVTLDNGMSYHAHDVLVTLESGTPEEEITRLGEAISMTGYELLAQGTDGYGAIILYHIPDTTTVDAVATALADDPEVASVERDYLLALPDEPYAPSAGGDAASEEAEAVSDDTGVSVEPVSPRSEPQLTAAATSIDDPYSSRQWSLTQTGMSMVWDHARCDNAVTVAVFDTGCSLEHEDLVDNIVASYNAADPGSPAEDEHGHGTNVCGIIAARADNGIGVAGASYNANLLPVRVTKPGSGGTASVSSFVRAYEYLLSDPEDDGTTVAERYNVRVVNISFAAPRSVFSTYGTEVESFEQEMSKTTDAGIVTVCAAGNTPYNTSTGSVTAPYAVIPADFDSCISVMNLEQTADATGVELSSGSNFNTAGSADKDICAPGTDIYTTRLGADGGSYNYASGTSMSAPFVSGVVALMYAVNPHLTVDQVKDSIYSSATDLGAGGWDEVYGYGAIDPMAAIRLADPDAKPQWSRIGGSNRYETMSLILGQAYPIDTKVDSIIVTRGDEFPDALCASGLAGILECPIITTPKEELSPYAEEVIGRLAAPDTRVYILGDENAVSSRTRQQIAGIVGAQNVVSVGGDNRYQTCDRIFDEGGSRWNGASCIIARGDNFADALSIASYAYATDTPILLTPSEGPLDELAEANIRESGIQQVIILGDDKAVPLEVDARLDDMDVDHIRLDGSNRYETCDRIIRWETGADADEVVQPLSTLGYENVVVTRGDMFPDALASAPFAGANNTVTFLVSDDRSEIQRIRAAFGPLREQIDRGYILGDSAAVPDWIELRLRAA